MTSPARPARIPRSATGLILTFSVAFILVGCLPGGNGSEAPSATSRAESSLASSQPSTVPAATYVVPEDSILFGQSAAFSGPAQELGRNMRLGIEAAFHEVNERGGVHGRELLLTYLDDAYEPEAAIANTRRLIEDEGVFALIGAVGTPTSRSAAPVAAEAGVPYIAPFTGAAFLRDPGWNNIVNLRASYNQETEETVARLTSDLGIRRIAIMYQDDSFGRAGYVGVRRALERRRMEPVSIGLYPRNTRAIKTALLDLRLGAPEAVVLIGAYQPVAELVSWARHTGLDPVFVTLSFVGSNALARELGPGGAGVVVTQVVPFPAGDSFPVTRRYRQALSNYAPNAEPGFVSLEGYLAGRLVVHALQICGKDVDRGCLLRVLRSATEFDIDGFPLDYGEDDNQGSDQVFLTIIGEDGGYLPLQTLRSLQR